MYKIILSALSLLALSGCGQPYQSYGFTPRDFSKEKAVVVMSIKGDASYSLLTQGLILEVIKFANDDGSYFPLMDENNYYTHDYHIHKHIFSKNILVMLIDPGYYSFNKIHLEVGNTIYFSPQKVRAVMDTNSKETFLLPYGGFYAKKGTVSYIGDIAIDLNYRTGGFSFAHEYKTDEAKEYLSNNYPALAEQLVEAPYYSGMITHNYL